MSDERRQQPEPRSSGPDRRTVVNVVLGTGLAGWLATILYPVLRYLSPLQRSVSADEVVVGDKAKDDINATGFAIVALGTERVLVFRDPQQRVRACSAKCTHEGCTVQYKADESIIWCACHNGRFDLDGRVLSGPPPRPLAAYKVAGSLDSKLVVMRPESA